MRFLRPYLITALSCILMTGNGVGTLGQPVNRIALSSGCSNYLYISGESNVNQFYFSFDEGSETPGKFYYSSPDNDELEIEIPVKEFRPSNPLMYEDFLTLMKATEYPMIKVTFSKHELEKISKNPDGNCPSVRISIAGVTREYQIQCLAIQCSQDLYLSGEKNMRFSDFHLKPPEKLLGLVKVNNEINVNFGFIITFTEINPLAAGL